MHVQIHRVKLVNSWTSYSFETAFALSPKATYFCRAPHAMAEIWAFIALIAVSLIFSCNIMSRLHHPIPLYLRDRLISSHLSYIRNRFLTGGGGKDLFQIGSTKSYFLLPSMAGTVPVNRRTRNTE